MLDVGRWLPGSGAACLGGEINTNPLSVGDAIVWIWFENPRPKGGRLPYPGRLFSIFG